MRGVCGLASAISKGPAIPAADNPAIFANWRRETLSDIDAAPERIAVAAQWRVGRCLKSGGGRICGCRIAGRPIRYRVVNAISSRTTDRAQLLAGDARMIFRSI